MKSIVLRLLFTFLSIAGINCVQAQTSLTAGDIAITGYNANPDAFSFVILKDINASTAISFTDNGWLSSGSFRANEGVITWTASAQTSCGTQVLITKGSSNSSVTASVGSASASGSFDLSTSGDQILAYQGSSSNPTFITAINFDGSAWASDATTANNSALPAGLTNGSNAANLSENDNGKYNCTVQSGAAAIRAAANTASNWSLGTTVYSLPPSCTFSCPLPTDCAGVPGGTATLDMCGICSGGTTGVTPNVDSDNDGTLDCNDGCPNDMNKTAPGNCGCGVPETLGDAGINDTICFGETATLTATGGTSYLWSNGSTTASITVNITTSTTYQVTVTANGCGVTDSAKVIVNALPAADAGINDTICLGDNANLVATGGTSYIWSNGVNTSTNTPASNTNTTYTVTVTDANGCTATDIVEVVVNTLPIADAGSNDTICVGETAALVASGGTSYAWSNGVNNQTSNPSPIANTAYTVTVTDANGCTATDIAEVIVNPLPNADAGSNDTICAGDAASLTASGGITYAWSNGDNIATLTTTLAGNYIVSVTDANGCIGVDSAIVAVNSLPVLTLSNDSSICLGSSISLSANGADTYDWSNGQTGNNITVTIDSNITFTVVATDTNACVASGSVTVTALALPIADAGNDESICLGDTASLLATGGIDYLWSNGTNAASNPVWPTDTIQYIVTVVDASGCENMDTVAVNILPLPIANAGADQTLCEGDTAFIQATGGMSYTWTTGATTSNISVAPATNTYFGVTAVNQYGCIDTDSLLVTITPLATIDFSALDSTFCIESGAFTLTAEPSGGTFTGTGVNGNLFDPALSGVGTFSLSYLYIDTNGCAVKDAVDVEITSCQGIETIGNDTYVTVYPNPFASILYIEIESPVNAMANIVLRDMTGKALATNGANASGDKVALDVANISAGMYFIEVTVNNKTTYHKVVKGN